MAFLDNFDAEQIEPQTDYDPLPEGYYTVVIVDSEWVDTAAGTGQFLKLQLAVCDGEYQNRVVFDRLNLKNPNAQAVSIAQSTLSAICRAVGVMRPKDSSELHNMPMVVRIKLERRKDRDDGTMSNVIKGYHPHDYAPPGRAPQAPQAARQPATPAATEPRRPVAPPYARGAGR